MTVLTSAAPVAEALYGVLQDAALQSALGGRLYQDLPQNVPQPCAFFEIFDETDRRGFGPGGLPEIDLRTHVYTAKGNLSEAHAINLQIVALLKDAAITVTGYAQCGLIVYHNSMPVPDGELNGVKVHEVVSFFTIWCEQT